MSSPNYTLHLNNYLNNRSDKKLKENLLVSLTGLIHSIVNKFKIKNEHDKEDLVQEGFIGALKALDTYDDNITVAFSTYIYYKALKAIVLNLKKTAKDTKAEEEARARIVVRNNTDINLNVLDVFRKIDYNMEKASERDGMFLLKYAQGESLRDISKDSSLSKSGVKSRIDIILSGVTL